MEDFVNCGNIIITKEQCIRTTFSKSHCRDCEDICIVDALTFSPFVSINKNPCIQCGLCYSACKFSAINIKKNNTQLLKACNKKQTIDIGCIFSNAEIKITCLSRLTEDVLINWFVSDKHITIKRGFCKTCKFKETLGYFNNSFKKSIILTKTLGKKPNIKIKTDKSEKVYIPRESVSRRNLLSGLNIIYTHYKSKRKILTEALPEDMEKDLPYPDSASLNIDSSCTLCGVCAHVCPVDALKIKKNEEKGSIYFYPTLCTACEACVESCLYNSITLERKTVSHMKTKPYKIFDATKRVCKICKKEFYSNKEEICNTCKLKENSKQQFIDFLKNL